MPILPVEWCKEKHWMTLGFRAFSLKTKLLVFPWTNVPRKLALFQRHMDTFHPCILWKPICLFKPGIWPKNKRQPWALNAGANFFVACFFSGMMQCFRNWRPEQVVTQVEKLCSADIADLRHGLTPFIYHAAGDSFFANLSKLPTGAPSVYRTLFYTCKDCEDDLCHSHIIDTIIRRSLRRCSSLLCYCFWSNFGVSSFFEM